MDPPDTRLSVKEIADALGLREREARRHLVRLSEMAYVRPFRVGNEAYYTHSVFDPRNKEHAGEEYRDRSEHLKSWFPTSKIQENWAPEVRGNFPPEFLRMQVGYTPPDGRHNLCSDLI